MIKLGRRDAVSCFHLAGVTRVHAGGWSNKSAGQCSESPAAAPGAGKRCIYLSRVISLLLGDMGDTCPTKKLPQTE